MAQEHPSKFLLAVPGIQHRVTRRTLSTHTAQAVDKVYSGSRSSEDFLTELANKLDGRTPVNGVPVARDLRRAYGYLFAWLLHRRAPQ